MQGSSCTLGATTFESDSRTLVQFFLSFRSLEVLELGGSIARRQFELANRELSSTIIELILKFQNSR